MPTNCDNEWFVGPVPVSKAFYGETQVYPCADDPGPDPGFGDSVAFGEVVWCGPSWGASNYSLKVFTKDGKWGLLGYKNDPYPNEVRPIGLDGLWGPSEGNYSEGGWVTATQTKIRMMKARSDLHDTLNMWNNSEGKPYENFNYNSNSGITLQAIPEVIWDLDPDVPSTYGDMWVNPNIQSGDYTFMYAVLPGNFRVEVPPPFFSGWIHGNKTIRDQIVSKVFCWVKTGSVRAGARQMLEEGEWKEADYTSFMRSLDG